jgi:hypothetical protein
VAAEVAMAIQRWEATEEQCERLVHELSLLSIKRSELCITISSAPSWSPLHEGMHFVVAQHTKVATWFFLVASFSIRGLLHEPLCIFWGCLFFHRQSFE